MTKLIRSIKGSGLLALLFLRSAMRVFRNAIAAIQLDRRTPRSPKIPIRIVKGPR